MDEVIESLTKIVLIFFFFFFFFLLLLKIGLTSSALPFFRPLPLKLYIFNIM